MTMFEPTDNQVVNVGLFLLDVFLSAWWVWLPGLVIWLISEARKPDSPNGSSGPNRSNGSGYRHDGAGGESGRGGGFGGGDSGDGGGGDGGG